jgi:hypothetical protein
MHFQVISKQIIVLLSLSFLVACSSGGEDASSNDNTKPPPAPDRGTVSFTAPSDGIGLPDTGTLTINVYVDGNTSAAASKTINTTDASANISVSVASGSHIFRVAFEYADPVFGGPYRLSDADSATINVTKGSSQSVTFDSSVFTYEDLDSDGITNLSELELSVRTDPADPTCVLDKSVIAGASAIGCTLG